MVELEGRGMSAFSEIQRFRQPWLMALLGVIVALGVGPFAFGLFRQLVAHHSFGTRPMSDTGLVAATAISGTVCAAIVWLMLAAYLWIEVQTDALVIRFFPFIRGRRIPYSQIVQATACRYSPILEYGGWGVRFGRNGKAYNVSGNWGVQLELASGERLLLGSQRAGELAAAIEALRRG